MEKFTLKINEVSHTILADPDTPLLWVIRDTIGLTGTKYGCGLGVCGACTVHFDGRSVRSCMLPVRACESKSVTTIEGLKSKEGRHITDAWMEVNVPQCGYCQSGQIMEAADLLKRNPNPRLEDINQSMSDILCRCGTYPRIRKAILLAAKKMSEE